MAQIWNPDVQSYVPECNAQMTQVLVCGSSYKQL